MGLQAAAGHSQVTLVLVETRLMLVVQHHTAANSETLLHNIIAAMQAKKQSDSPQIEASITQARILEYIYSVIASSSWQFFSLIVLSLY